MRDLGGALSYRRLAVLLRHAPPGSAFAQSYHGEAGAWTPTDYLLAEIIDRLGVIASAKRLQDVPKPFPRPRSSRDDMRQGMSAEEAWRLFESKEA